MSQIKQPLVLTLPTGGGSNYTLPVADTSILGGIKVGAGLSIAAGGALSTSVSSDLTTLTDPAFYDIAAGYSLLNTWILPSSDATTSIGLSAGAEDVAASDVTTAVDGKQYVLNLFAKNTKRIFFTGLPVGSTVIVQTKKIL